MTQEGMGTRLSVHLEDSNAPLRKETCCWCKAGCSQAREIRMAIKKKGVTMRVFRHEIT